MINIIRNCMISAIKNGTSIRALSTSTDTSHLTQVSDRHGVRHIVLNNSRARNALSLEMMTEILSDLKRNKADENLRCIVLSGNGPVFSAGHNLKELTKDTGADFHRRVFEMCTEMMLEIAQSPVPVIAKINGLAAAAGCQLAATCDIVICSDNSSFSTPGSNFGIFCSTPGIAVARTVSRKKSLYMLLTGFPISAAEALECGLVSSVVPAEQLDAEVDRVCDSIKSKSRAVVERGKHFFYQQVAMNIKTAYKYGEHEMVANLDMKDGQEGVRSFMEKRKPHWTHTNE